MKQEEETEFLKKAKENLFVCAECEKKVKAVSFPYDKGWLYLYAFQWKTNKDIQQSAKDKHLCSKNCLIEFAKKNLD